MPNRSTIFALSSGRPPAAIAVVRVSGPRAGVALEKLIGRLPEPRKAALARVGDPASGEVIDEALALWFPAPRSETGEDVAELQLHGGQAVIAGVLDALSMIEGCRPAEAGEFTRHAFENGLLDLTAVEGLADLIAAETPAQRRLAFRQLKGLIGDRAEAWRRRLIEALALVEARIDFSDEADVPEDLLGPALYAAQQLRDEIAGVLADGRRGERLRDGLVVAIAGPPDAGKSTLLNRIARREAAIVSPYAGTTRDVIEVHLDLAGWPVTLLDTAGIRESDDPVEREGVRRARDRAAAADLVLWVVDAAACDSPTAQGPKDQPTWLIRNKFDLIATERRNEASGESIHRNELRLLTNETLKNTVNKRLTSSNEHRSADNGLEFSLSAASGQGFEELLTALARHAEAFLAGAEPALVTRERHRRSLEDALAALRGALGPEVAGREDLLAEELHIASRSL